MRKSTDVCTILLHSSSMVKSPLHHLGLPTIPSRFIVTWCLCRHFCTSPGLLVNNTHSSSSTYATNLAFSLLIHLSISLLYHISADTSPAFTSEAHPNSNLQSRHPSLPTHTFGRGTCPQHLPLSPLAFSCSWARQFCAWTCSCHCPRRVLRSFARCTSIALFGIGTAGLTLWPR